MQERSGPRRRGGGLFLLALILTPALLGGGPAARRSLPAMAGGIHINEPDLASYARAVSAAGLNSVQVTVYARQGRWDSADIGFDPVQAEADVIVQLRAAHEQGLAVVLVLRVYLEHWLPENRHLWHGMIWPVDDQLDPWFAAYGDFVRWGAEIAEREGVEALVIGSELNSMSSTLVPSELPELYGYLLDGERTAKVRSALVSCAAQVPPEQLKADLSFLDGHRYPDLDSALRDQEDGRARWAMTVAGGSDGLSRLQRRAAALQERWTELISATRGRYSGPLLYGANFDQFDQVGFWDQLDGLAVTAYFPLGLWGGDREQQAEQLLRGWRRAAESLQRVARRGDGRPPLPIYLMELGWTRKAGSTVRPWSYSRVEVLETVGEVGEGEAPPLTCVHWASQPERPEERVAALDALLRLRREGSFDELRGFSLWKLTTRDYHWKDEQFAILLPSDGPDQLDLPADRALLRAAAALAKELGAEGPAR